MKNKLINKIIFIIFILVVILLLVNIIIVRKTSFILNGNERIYLNTSDSWNDPGYNVLEKYRDNVKVNSNLNLHNEGKYIITYTLKIGLFTKKIEREVNVVTNDSKSDLSFKLNKDNPYYLIKNSTYQEYGATAHDISDGDISNKIIIDSSDIKNDRDGTYYVKYKISTTNGITREIERKVIVYSFNFEGKLKTDEYSQSNEIILAITDKNYSYVILPDGNESTNRIINYPVSENGDYLFKLYDKNNSVQEYNISVTNIDKEKPTGTCEMSLLNTGAIISVKANDNGIIKGYQYHYGNNNTKIITETSFNIDTLDDKATITIFDMANNSTDISCNTIDNSTKYERSYSIESIKYNDRDRQFWLYRPEHSVREKLPLLVYFHGDGGRSNIKNVSNYAFPKFIKDGMDFPFYMIAPYCSNDTDFSSGGKIKEVLQIIEYVTKNYNIDTDRIIISGGSSGGRGAYTIAAYYQNIFSCLVVGSGVTFGTSGLEKDLAYLPIWIFHGKNDKNVSFGGAEALAKRIRAAGGNVKFSAIDGGHEITETVFKDPELIEWMISQRKSNQKK